MNARVGLLIAACGSSPVAAAPSVERDDNERDRPCTMSMRCPADDLPRFDDALSVAGWAQLRAATRTIAVRIEDDRVVVDEDCVLDGAYVEVARAAKSPGRAWGSTRLVFTPDELEHCEHATHLVAAFAVKNGAKRGTAIALPLPCGDGTCLGVPQQDRKAAAQQRWDRAKPIIHVDPRPALRDLVEMTALQPTPSSYRALASALSFMTSTEYGGCLWLSEAEMAGQRLDPSARPGKRLVPQHDEHDCRTQPSLVTCFPDHFVAGEGGNCW